MASVRRNLRFAAFLVAGGAVPLLVVFFALFAEGGRNAAGAMPYNLTGVSRISFTVPEIPGLAPEIHAVCLARADQVSVTGDDDVTVRAMCYQANKTAPGTPPAPPPPPPPYDPADHRVLLGTVADETDGLVQLTFQGCLAPVPVGNPTPGGTPTPSGLEVLVTAKADKSGWLADGTDEVILKLDQTIPLDCADGSQTSNTFTPQNLPANDDADGDGCTTWDELGDIDPDGAGPLGPQHIGGLRDPWNPYDFYDTNGDTVVDLPNDILGVILRWSPNPSLPYDAAYDRGPTIGPNAWNKDAPDGSIDLPNDILGVILQWQHDCSVG